MVAPKHETIDGLFQALTRLVEAITQRVIQEIKEGEQNEHR